MERRRGRDSLHVISGCEIWYMPRIQTEFFGAGDDNDFADTPSSES